MALFALSASSPASADSTATPSPAATPPAATTSTTTPSPAAQPTRVDALFTAGKQLRDAGLYEDACPKFAEAEQIDPGVGVMLYLADCYQHTSRSANAWAEFRKAEKLARERNDKRQDLAKARADALEAKLARMTIAVADPAKHTGLEIAVDGTRILPENWNATLPTDPGVHAVAIEEPGQPPRILNVHIDEGANLIVPAFEAPSAPAPTSTPYNAPTPATTETPADAAPARPTSTRMYVGLGLLGVGAIGVVAGAGYLDAKNDAISKGKRSSAGTFAGVSFAVGAAGFASAIVLYLTAPKDPSSALTVSPTVGDSGAGALLRGSF
jgi:serine/threonine-protein kinase